LNRKSARTQEAKPAEEQITVPVDPIFDAATFDAVQAMLKAKNPRSVPPRVVTGPILLTGIATCGRRGGGMTPRTGKSGRYRNYTCATCARKSKSARKGRSIPMQKLDQLVTDRLAEKLLAPDRVGKLLAGLLERQSSRDEGYALSLTALRTKLADAENRLGRLYATIESGIADPSDATLKERVAVVKSERDIAQVSFDRVVVEMRPETRISEEKIASFVEVMRKNVLSGDTPFRRAYIRSMIDQVEVDDAEIHIHGRQTVL
jgi:site-specific DNA recombinase